MIHYLVKNEGRDNNSLEQIISKTSEMYLTSKENDYKPFWDEFCDEISYNLLSHIQIDSAYLKTYFRDQENKSWFLTENKFHKIEDSQKNFLQYYKSSFVECERLDTQIKSRKIRIYPTQQQKILFKKWFGVSRKFYNETLVIYKNGSNKVWNKVFQEIAEQNKDYD